MQKYKYYYLDDEDENSVQALIDSINHFNLVTVERLVVGKSTTVEDVANKIAETDCDGFIVDFMLRSNSEFGLNYTAATLVQHIRTENVLNISRKQFPIIVFSTMRNLKEIVGKDVPMSYLYDYAMAKDSITKENIVTLKSLADAYRFCSNKNLSKETLLSRDDFDGIGKRFLDSMSGINSDISPYKIVSFVFKDMIGHPGILIDEDVLAARLGIDKELCEESWKSLLQKIKDCKLQYEGVLSDVSKRYWADKVFDWFKSLTEQNLYSLNANERVSLISKNLGINGLIPARPIDLNESLYYDTVCSCLRKPMDSSEGLEIKETQPLTTWQESRYLSISAYGSGKCGDVELTKSGKDRWLYISEDNEEPRV